jgi:hypothetical protein
MQMFIYNVSTQTLLIGIFLGPILAIVTVLFGLASFGASFGLRKMYAKALLKIFEVSNLRTIILPIVSDRAYLLILF